MTASHVVAPGIGSCQGRSTIPATTVIIAAEASIWNVAVPSGGESDSSRRASGSSGQGAPTASLVTTRNGSWVLGVGNDWDNAISRTPGAGQVLVHQYVAPVGDTYWVQRQNTAAAASGTTVSINDTAPATDQYNLTICEVLPATS